jgi:hypothetical protein
MPQAKGAARAPTPNEDVRVRPLHADVFNVVERPEDCAGKLGEVISSPEVSQALREEAGMRILWCALKLEDAGLMGQAVSLLDKVQRDKTLSRSLREEASRLLIRISMRWAERLNDLENLGKLS